MRELSVRPVERLDKDKVSGIPEVVSCILSDGQRRSTAAGADVRDDDRYGDVGKKERLRVLLTNKGHFESFDSISNSSVDRVTRCREIQVSVKLFCLCLRASGTSGSHDVIDSGG